MVKVELKKLRPNPLRDFKIDPLEDDDLRKLKDSISEHGFWGGVVLRKGKNGEHEIMAGHRRIAAGIEAGIESADLHVGKYDDKTAIRIYVTENVTQRGTTAGLAMAGAVASSIRYIAKALLKDDSKALGGIQPSEFARGKALSALESENQGIGWSSILNFYKGIDGINKNLVKEHLANLKASGDYARIIGEVTAEVEEEHAAELAELAAKKKEAEEKAEADRAAKLEKEKAKAQAKASRAKEVGKKASAAAAAKPATFDLAGVGKYLTTQHQLKTFRKIVERDSIKEHLPVGKQAELAQALVKHAEENNLEVTGAFIEQYVGELIYGVVSEETKTNKEAMREMERVDLGLKWDKLAHHFCLNVGGIAADARRMIKMKDQNPDLKFSITQELRKAVTYAQPAVNELAAKLNI